MPIINKGQRMKIPHDKFCVLPWVSIETSPIGTVRPCCLAVDEITKTKNVTFIAKTKQNCFCYMLLCVVTNVGGTTSATLQEGRVRKRSTVQSCIARSRASRKKPASSIC